VSGRLKHFDALASVHNHAVSGASVLRSHIVYERTRIFLATISAGLVGRSASSEGRQPDAEIVNAARLLARASPRLSCSRCSSCPGGRRALALMVLLPASTGPAASTARREGPRVALENISATIFGVAILRHSHGRRVARARTLHREYWATEKA